MTIFHSYVELQEGISLKVPLNHHFLMFCLFEKTVEPQVHHHGNPQHRRRMSVFAQQSRRRRTARRAGSKSAIGSIESAIEALRYLESW